MYAILLNPRSDKSGLVGRPVATTAGMCSALNGTHRAGINVTLFNMRGIRDKLQQAQLAINGCNQNLAEIGKNLDIIEEKSEKVKDATSRLGDYWTQFLNHPVTEESVIRFLDVSMSMDKSRQDMLGESVDPFYINGPGYMTILSSTGEGPMENAVLLPRAGYFLPISDPGWISRDWWDYYTTVTMSPWADPFGSRLPDSGFWIYNYNRIDNYGRWGYCPSSYPDPLTAPGVMFLGATRRNMYYKGAKTLLPEYGDLFGICIRPRMPGSLTNPEANNWGYGRIQDASVPCWISYAFYGPTNGAAIELPHGRMAIGTFDARDGSWLYGNCWPADVTIHYKDFFLEDNPYVPGQKRPIRSINPYEIINGIEYAFIGNIDDDGYPSGEEDSGGQRYDSAQAAERLGPLQFQTYYTKLQDGSQWACSLAANEYVVPHELTLTRFPCVGTNQVDLGDSAAAVKNAFDLSTTFYAVAKGPLPRETIQVLPSYAVNTHMYKFNGNVLDVPPQKIGYRTIQQTVVWVSTSDLGTIKFYEGPEEALIEVPILPGKYMDVQVFGISNGQVILLFERTRIRFDGTVGFENRINNCKFIENVFYNFDPWAETGDIFDAVNNKGKLMEAFAQTFDGHTISYRANCSWRDVFNELTTPPQWEFRQASYDTFYNGY